MARKDYADERSCNYALGQKGSSLERCTSAMPLKDKGAHLNIQGVSAKPWVSLWGSFLDVEHGVDDGEPETCSSRSARMSPILLSVEDIGREADCGGPNFIRHMGPRLRN